MIITIIIIKKKFILNIIVILCSIALDLVNGRVLTIVSATGPHVGHVEGHSVQLLVLPLVRRYVG